jgi:hypothetical protein
MKLCPVCGVVTSRSTGRCSEHPRLSGLGANHHIHADPRWTRLSKRMIARHVGQHGYVCPGYGPEHPAHPTRDLTLDHVLALIDKEVGRGGLTSLAPTKLSSSWVMVMRAGMTRSRGGFPFESGRRQPGAQLQGYPLETLHHDLLT